MLAKVGEVFHSFINEIIPPKNKYLVCIQEEEQWFLLINTENREMYECIEISYIDYPFLGSKNRYVSCSRIIQLQTTQINHNKRYGKLKKEHLELIFNKIKHSKRLSIIQKKKLFHTLLKE